MPQKKDIQSVALHDVVNNALLHPITTSDNVIMDMTTGETLMDFVDRVAPKHWSHVSWVCTDMTPSLIEGCYILSGQTIYDITGKKMTDFGLNIPPPLFDTSNSFHYNKYTKTFLRLYNSSPSSFSNTISYELYKYQGPNHRPERINETFRSQHMNTISQYPVNGIDSAYTSTRLIGRFDELFSVACNPNTGGFLVALPFKYNSNQQTVVSIDDPVNKDEPYARNIHSRRFNKSDAMTHVNMCPFPDSTYMNVRSWSRSPSIRSSGDYDYENYLWSPSSIVLETNQTSGNSMGDTLRRSLVPRREIQNLLYTPDVVITLSVKHGSSRLYFERFEPDGSASASQRTSNGVAWAYRRNYSYNFDGSGYPSTMSTQQIIDYVIHGDYIYILYENGVLYRLRILDRTLTKSMSECFEYDEIFGGVTLPAIPSAIEVSDYGVLCKGCISRDNAGLSYFYNWDRKANRKVYHYNLCRFLPPARFFAPRGKYNMKMFPKFQNGSQYGPPADFRGHASSTNQPHTTMLNRQGLVHFGSIANMPYSYIALLKEPYSHIPEHMKKLRELNIDFTSPQIYEARSLASLAFFSDKKTDDIDTVCIDIVTIP